MEFLNAMIDINADHDPNIAGGENILQLLNHQSEPNSPLDEHSSEGTLPRRSSQNRLSTRSSNDQQMHSSNTTENSINDGQSSTHTESTSVVAENDVNNERSTLISDEVSFVVKEEPLSDYATMRSILDPNYSQMAADSSSSMLFEEQKPRCRPRAPKHPIWTFFKFHKTKGPVNGYMCELCGGYFIGAANTTNATKHLKCRHKEEFAEYIELYDSAKRGSFVGALHDVLREIMLKGRAKRLGISNALSLQPAFAISKGECKDVQKFEKSRCEWQTSTLKSHASSSKDSSSVPSSSAANGGSDSKVYVQQHSAVTVCQSQNAAVPLSDCSYAEQAIKKSRLNESTNGSNESPNKVLADQMESFLKSFRQLEDECQDLRCQLSAKDEQIASLKLQLIHEKKKRESALFLIQQSLMDSGSTD